MIPAKRRICRRCDWYSPCLRVAIIDGNFHSRKMKSLSVKLSVKVVKNSGEQWRIALDFTGNFATLLSSKSVIQSDSDPRLQFFVAYAVMDCEVRAING
jgi:hypothetical protein